MQGRGLWVNQLADEASLNEKNRKKSHIKEMKLLHGFHETAIKFEIHRELFEIIFDMST